MLKQLELTEGLSKVSSSCQGIVQTPDLLTITVCNIFITYLWFVMERQVRKVSLKSKFGSHIEVA